MAIPKEPVTEEKKEGYQKIEEFFKRYRNIIIGVLAVAVIFVGGRMAYKNLFVKPKIQTAKEKIVAAERHFMKDSIQLALHGDGINPGFLTIIKKYGGTPSGNLARYYAGACFMTLTDFNQAIEHLKKFDSDDELLQAHAYWLIGQAYSGLEKMDDAYKYYVKATEAADSDMSSTYYKTAGDMAVKLEKYAEAKEFYETIKSRYPNSQEGRLIERDLGMVEAKL